MTITVGAPPTHSTPAALVRGFLTGGVVGASLAALVVGGVIEKWPLFVAGLVVPAVYGLLFFLAGAPQFDPRSLPYERFPALVEEARTTLGIRSPQTWQITAERLTGSLTIRVGVTGAEGTASLEADGQGKVVRRTPVG
ncbi:hypothetical protein ACIBCS_40610 [Streptomyces phaeochromogenes]|uniref:hypothetical protein n=1 Tax=Streptomyces phaeochromogenes TaxID=1923 RepID=UPI003409D09B